MELERKLNAAKWVANYGDSLYTFVLSRVSNQFVAEDIVQDTFLSAWRAKDTYNGLASEKNWLFAICKNKIIDYYRKSSTTDEILATQKLSDDIFFDDAGHWLYNTSPKIWNFENNNIIEKKEFYEILKKCKSKLNAVQESVFTMKYLEDVETNEICEILGISVQNYWVLIHRAKINLRSCLEKNWINA